jgi:MinD-like ATPase involved in chromosome partitioning or flagellar assembly
VPVLTAVTDARWEAGIVGAFENGAHGVVVVRRCVDLADLLATAAAGTARAVLLSADLRRLDREALARLAVAGVAVVGVGEAAAFARLGVLHTVPVDAAPEDVADAVVNATLAALPPRAEPVREEEPDGTGRVVAVWGPAGAPGRTTLAVTLATELAALGLTTTLVDADVYGGAVAQSLGLLDEAPGLAAAVRLATSGLLDRAALAEVARAIGPNLRVLTGITRAERWPELRPTGVENVLALCRALAAFTVVDCGFALEQDEELSYDQAANRRNGATLAVLAAADTTVAVGSADPVSLQRLVRALGDLPAAPEVVVNRLRNGVMPGNPESEIAAALARYAGVTPATFLPYDRAATDSATMRGLSLTEAAPASPLRLAIGAYAASLAGVPAERPRRRLGRRVLA